MDLSRLSSVLGQIPITPPSEFNAFLQGLLFVVGVIAGIVIALNQLIVLFDRVRGKQQAPPGYSNVTQTELEKSIVPIVDALARHEKRDSDEFKEVRKGQELSNTEARHNFGVLFRKLERIDTALRMKGYPLPSDHEEESNAS